jgi:hypothetical protein
MSTPAASGPMAWRRTDLWQVVALGLSLLASLVLLVVPAFGGTSASSETGGREVVRTTTLLESEGPRVLLILLIPVILTLLPLLVRGRARRQVALACTLLLALGALVGLASIGAFYLPALIFAIAATTAAMTERGGPQPASR